MPKARERNLTRPRIPGARRKEDTDPVTRVPDDIDVRAVRRRLDLTRRAFSQRFGLAVDAVKEWETGRRRPDRATRVLLKIIDCEPDAVERVLDLELRRR